MKNMNNSRQLGSNSARGNFVRRGLARRDPLLRINQSSLTECDILALNEKFLTPGFHNIQVLSHQDGRALLWRFLSYLTYDNIACLSMNYPVTHKHEFIMNLYDQLQIDNLLYDEQAMNEFLLNEFAFDFMWIELSKELSSQPWFLAFKYKLVEYKLSNELPIIIVHA